MFLLFITARGKLPAYTGVLYGAANGGGGPGGIDTKPSKSAFDKDGDGFDKGDAANIAAKVVPWPFNIPFEFMDTEQA
jgi:hypothetical protein